MPRLGLSNWFLAACLALLCGACASLPPPAPHAAETAWASPQATALGQWVARRRAADPSPRDSGFLLLGAEHAAFAARLALVQQAQRTLDLQYYAIHADATTEVLLEALRGAARRGVRVRILLDDFNTVGRDAQVLRLAFEPNVQLRLFNPLPGSRDSLVGRLLMSLRDLPLAGKRMHNKLFIADNAAAVAGGRNLGDAYFGADGKSNFVDLDVLAAGGVVRDLSASFDRYWNDELAYPVQSLISRADLETLRREAASAAAPADRPRPAGESLPQAAAPQAARPAASAAVLQVAASVLPGMTRTAVVSARMPPLDLDSVPLTWAPAAVLADAPGKIGPDDDEANAGDTVVDGLLQLMGQARQDVLVVTPYFIPGRSVMQTFADLRARGVRVRVLTNSLASNDAIAAHAGYARHRAALLALGVELYEMRAAPGEAGVSLGGSARGGLGSAGGGSKSGAPHASLHSKALVVDGRSVVIGSMNLDLRSQRKNSEVALLVRSAVLARGVQSRVEGVLASNAYRVLATPGGLLWKAPPGAAFGDSREEPLAGARLRALAALVAPFAPDELL
ncbi:MULTISPECIES: phospholipase D family protein [Ramlibacter]|uniref:Phospholipase D family protein n=1 Tax=Ramlibacter aquaticus TaxID=2780094 RepID=A0ABR9SE20_9BURK|nr:MULTISPECIES: phospholipase D family protein [Ramlibacter]MBE7940535.1 phospholipase D family protein [Ramlibacter aquaticus]